MGSWWTRLSWALLAARDNELRQVIMFLQAENEILRRQVPKRRILVSQQERSRLIELGRTVSSQVLKLITIVHPRTWQRWLRAAPATPPADSKSSGKKQELRELVIRLATETNWGYGRIHGELLKLGFQISESTVRNILKAAGITPGPERGGAWKKFVQAQLDSLWQIDFFSQRIVTPSGLRQAFVLAFLHVGSRRVFCSPCSFQPDQAWMVAQARACLQEAAAAGLAMTHLVHDRDGMFVREFDEVFTSAHCEVLKTAPRAPNQNAFIERWVRSMKSECLRYFIVFGQRHFDFLISRYLAYYNTLRPHQGRDNRPLAGAWPEAEEPLQPDEIVCREFLGGVLRHYGRRAA